MLNQELPTLHLFILHLNHQIMYEQQEQKIA